MTWEEIGYNEWAMVNNSGKILGRVMRTGRTYIAYRSLANPLGEYISLEHAKAAFGQEPAPDEGAG